jgi:hypothetical protein
MDVNGYSFAMTEEQSKALHEAMVKFVFRCLEPPKMIFGRMDKDATEEELAILPQLIEMLRG